MANIKLKNSNGDEIIYSGVETLSVPNSVTGRE